MVEKGARVNFDLLCKTIRYCFYENGANITMLFG